MQASPLKQKAEELGLAWAAPESCRAPEFIESVGALEPDFLLVAAYGQIMPVALLETGRQGAFNLHGSILPWGRGAAPIQRAIMAGLTETGVTLMQMAKGMDSGDIIAIAKTAIGADETYGVLHDRLAALAGGLASDWAERLAEGGYPRTPQDAAEAVYVPKIAGDEFEIRWDDLAADAYNCFRGLTPPGPSLVTSAGRIKILEARLADADEMAGIVPAGIVPAGIVLAGTVVSNSPECIISFTGGGLVLKTVQPEGKRPVSGRDWLNGHRLKRGDRILPSTA